METIKEGMEFIGGMSKSVKIGVAVAVAFIIIVVLILVVYFLFFKDDSSKSTFKSKQSNLDPLTQFYSDNLKLNESYKAGLNNNIADVYNVYKQFVDNPGKSAPKIVYEGAKQTLNFLKYSPTAARGTTEGQSIEFRIQKMVDLLKVTIESMYYNSQKVSSTNTAEYKAAVEYFKTDSESQLQSYLNEFVVNGNKDIVEDAVNALQHADYGISRYVEAMEADPNIVGADARTLRQHLAANGRLNMPSRAYPGTPNSKVIADVDFDSIYDSKEETNKDYSYAKPGIIPIARDIPTVNYDYLPMRVSKV